MKTPENNQPQNTVMGDALARATQQATAQQPAQPTQPTQPQFTTEQQQPIFNNNAQGFNAQANPQGGADRKSRIFDMNQRRERTFSAQNFSENFKLAADAMEEFAKGYEDQGYKKSWFIIPLQDANLHCGALIYVLGVSTTMTAVYTYMLENTGSPLKPLPGNDPITQERFELARMTGSQYDDIYWGAVQQKVISTLKLGQNVQVLEAGAGVIHSEMDWKDTGAISKLMNNAENAAITFANRLSGYQIEAPLNLVAEINPAVDRLSAGFNFSPLPLYTADGQPVRNDVEIKLTVSSDGDVQVQNSEPFTTVNGYVELVSAGNQPVMIPNQWGQMLPAPQRYYPQLAITNISQGISNAEGPEFQLVGLFTGTLLMENNNWQNAFAPRMVNGVDINDIGALNYELRMGVDPADPNARPKKIDTKTHEFNTLSLSQLLNAACFPSMSMVLDIEETGHRNWVNSMFLQAGGMPGTEPANLSQDGKLAHDAIIAAANNLTNGKFAEFFVDPKALITIRDGSRIQGGFYIDEKGARLDIRNVDLLAVLNFLGESDPRKVDEWKMICSSTSGLSGPKRIALRQQFLQTILGASYQQKCYYERVMVNHVFLDALRKALTAGGVQVRPENMSNQYNSMSYGTPLAAQYGFNTNIGSSLVPGGYAQVDNQGRNINFGQYRTPFGHYQS
ncbi:hypothetical protein pEaSNUABM37_00253 [Erwinia phage pEa_SNUABM_37]|nr:hypothetical protein pEaSNUABM37_00253 [Erwinia phage pEa_SNUABM_37]QXO10721.1 hypothetical protein pEaSNUABM48_00253 [Erwinia phage pEa_SNUABM_48]